MFKVGAAAVEITPDLGSHLAGAALGAHRPARSVRDPLYAKAVALELDGKRACVVTLDVTILTEDQTQLIRAEALRRFGLPAEAVMVQATQTHSAPSLGQCMLDPDFPLDAQGREWMAGSDPSYFPRARAGAVEAIAEAIAALKPARMGHGRTEAPQFAFNRRGEETIDPEVAVVDFRGLAGEWLAMILHYTAHPVIDFGRGWSNPQIYHSVTADWPGAWALRMRKRFDVLGPPMVINGACGNINPGSYDHLADWDIDLHGRGLAKAASGVVASITPSEVDRLDYRIRHIGLDYREVPAERLAEVERILSANPKPKPKDDTGEVDPTWFLAASTRSVEHCRRRVNPFRYEIQAIRLGDVAIVGLPGEPFAEGQLDLKRRSPAKRTIVAHLTTQYVGYLPTREAYPRQGHEANPECTYWAKLAPGSLEKVIDSAVGLLGEMF